MLRKIQVEEDRSRSERVLTLIMLSAANGSLTLQYPEEALMNKRLLE